MANFCAGCAPNRWSELSPGPSSISRQLTNTSTGHTSEFNEQQYGFSFPHLRLTLSSIISNNPTLTSSYTQTQFEVKIIIIFSLWNWQIKFLFLMISLWVYFSWEPFKTSNNIVISFIAKPLGFNRYLEYELFFCFVLLESHKNIYLGKTS